MHLICHLDDIKWKSNFRLAYFPEDSLSLTLIVGTDFLWLPFASLNWIYKIICYNVPKINQEIGLMMLSVKSKRQFS